MAKVKITKNKIHIPQSTIGYFIGLPLDALLIMWAGHSFNHNFNWGQSFWLSFFYNGIISAINSIKDE